MESLKFIEFQDRGGIIHKFNTLLIDTWKDIEPVLQYEGGKAPICPIAYLPECMPQW
jgi:hypothetical protein